MPETPEVLAILKRCGIRQQDIADHFHIPKSSVSFWTKGIRPIPLAYLPDFWDLAALARDYIEQGRPGREALSKVSPTVLESFSRSGGTIAVGRIGSIGPVDADLTEELIRLSDAYRRDADARAFTRIHLVHLAQAIRNIRSLGTYPSQPTVEDLPVHRQHLLAALIALERFQEDIARYGPLPRLQDQAAPDTIPGTQEVRH